VTENAAATVEASAGVAALSGDLGFGLFFEVETYTAADELHNIASYLLLGSTKSEPKMTLYTRERWDRTKRTQWNLWDRSTANTMVQNANNDLVLKLTRALDAASLYSPDSSERPHNTYTQRIVNIVTFEITDVEHAETRKTRKTPYYAIDRVKRTLRARGVTL
jgi:hypothetical protein